MPPRDKSPSRRAGRNPARTNGSAGRTARLGGPRGAVPIEDRLDDLVKVATRLFREQGFRATRLDDISDALGVTRAALYYYFDGKSEILEEVCTRAMAATEQALDEAQAIADAMDRLRWFALRYVSNQRGDAAVVFYRENGELRPEFRKAIMRRARKVNEGAEDIFRVGATQKHFRTDLDVRLTAIGLLGMLNALAEAYRPRDGDLAAQVNQLLEVLLTGVSG